MTTRRNFLTQAGLLTGAAVLLKSELLSAKPTGTLGLQLYSLREYLPKDVKGVIEKVAKAGYSKVETYGYSKANGYWGLPAKDFGALLKANGLTSPSGHFDLGSYFVKGDTEIVKTYIESAHAVGQQYVIVPWMPNELVKTLDGCKKVAERLNKLGEMCKAAGLKTGYHNHDFEFKPVENTTFYNVLLSDTDASLVPLEMDIYWVARGGLDAVKLLNNYKGRFKLVHVKDRDKTNPKLNTEIGNGDIDYKSILQAAKKSGVQHLIVEQENFTNIDPYVSIAKSASYLKNTLHV